MQSGNYSPEIKLETVRQLRNQIMPMARWAILPNLGYEISGFAINWKIYGEGEVQVDNQGNNLNNNPYNNQNNNLNGTPYNNQQPVYPSAGGAYGTPPNVYRDSYASIPEPAQAPPKKKKGMPWWGILLIILGSMGILSVLMILVISFYAISFLPGTRGNSAVEPSVVRTENPGDTSTEAHPPAFNGDTIRIGNDFFGYIDVPSEVNTYRTGEDPELAGALEMSTIGESLVITQLLPLDNTLETAALMATAYSKQNDQTDGSNVSGLLPGSIGEYEGFLVQTEHIDGKMADGFAFVDENGTARCIIVEYRNEAYEGILVPICKSFSLTDDGSVDTVIPMENTENEGNAGSQNVNATISSYGVTASVLNVPQGFTLDDSYDSNHYLYFRDESYNYVNYEILLLTTVEEAVDSTVSYIYDDEDEELLTTVSGSYTNDEGRVFQYTYAEATYLNGYGTEHMVVFATDMGNDSTFQVCVDLYQGEAFSPEDYYYLLDSAALRLSVE